MPTLKGHTIPTHFKFCLDESKLTKQIKKNCSLEYAEMFGESATIQLNQLEKYNNYLIEERLKSQSIRNSSLPAAYKSILVSSPCTEWQTYKSPPNINQFLKSIGKTEDKNNEKINNKRMNDLKRTIKEQFMMRQKEVKKSREKKYKVFNPPQKKHPNFKILTFNKKKAAQILTNSEILKHLKKRCAKSPTTQFFEKRGRKERSRIENSMLDKCRKMFNITILNSNGDVEFRERVKSPRPIVRSKEFSNLQVCKNTRRHRRFSSHSPECIDWNQKQIELFAKIDCKIKESRYRGLLSPRILSRKIVLDKWCRRETKFLTSPSQLLNIEDSCKFTQINNFRNLKFQQLSNINTNIAL